MIRITGLNDEFHLCSQITASVTFLPLLEVPCSFDVLIYTGKDTQMPQDWAESSACLIENAEQVRKVLIEHVNMHFGFFFSLQVKCSRNFWLKTENCYYRCNSVPSQLQFIRCRRKFSTSLSLNRVIDLILPYLILLSNCILCIVG